MKPEIIDLLLEIQDWMRDNDYECGPHGGQIYDRIDALLKEHGIVRDDER